MQLDQTLLLRPRHVAVLAATCSGEMSTAVVGESLFDFLACIHDERPVLNHRLA
jgi:hypothetical protein